MAVQDGYPISDIYMVCYSDWSVWNLENSMVYPKFIIFIGTSLLFGCSTAPTETSAKVTEYESVEQMGNFADCIIINTVEETYDVTLHSSLGIKRASHIYLKEAAFAQGANAVIMTSNNYGVATDQVQGIAYACNYSRQSRL